MFKDHLIKSKVTYFKHLAWAILAGLRLIYAGIASIVHGVVPILFDGTAPKTIIDIYHSHLVNHPNEEYKDMIDQAKKDNE
jgi:hypothetical protein